MVVKSAWLEHAPFAFWLVDALRPTSIVELGTHNGFSFFTFCEAVQRLGIDDAKVVAVDSWEGDEHAGFYGEEVFAGVSDTVASRYAEMGRLRRGYFDDVRPEIQAGSVDLLHIDGRHRYDDVRNDLETWSDTITPGGVILFHDIAVTHEDFGVWRLWDELSERHPAFTFVHGNGLGVLAPNGVPDALRPLLEADEGEAERVRSFYSQQGAEIAADWTRRERLDVLESQVAESEHRIAELEVALSARESEVRAYAERVEEIRSSTSWRVTAPVRAVGRLIRRR